MNYSESITPNVTSVSPNSGSGLQTININGNHFIGTGQTDVFVGETQCNITTLSMTSISCTIGSTLPTGNHSIDVFVEDIGDSNENVYYKHDLTIINITPSVGGFGGGLITTIQGFGFNGSNVNISICNKSCLSIDIVSNNEIDCLTPSMTMSSTNTLCNLSLTVNGITKDTQFTYQTNLTASITSVTPNRGGTGGGTIITINGTNFPFVFSFFLSLFNRLIDFRTSVNEVNVKIGDTTCSVTSVSRTQISCETGSHRYSSVEVPIMVSINGSGYAQGSLLFEYIDFWSSPFTWGGEDPPEEGTLVIIENRETIYLDIVTPIIRVLVIDNATLIFEDSQDVELNVEYIVIVNNGHLIVGTQSNPFKHRGVITIHGHLRSIELPICNLSFLFFSLFLDI